MSGRARARWHCLDGRRVRVLEAGSGAPLVVVHGLGLSASFWAPHFPALTAAGQRVIAPDLPGFGRSEGIGRGMSVPETSAWLLALADEIGLDRATWLGHSLAAQAVLDVVVRAPARSTALVLVTPTGAPGRLRLLRQCYGFVRDIGREPLALIPVVAREWARGSLRASVETWVKAARDDPLDKAAGVRCPTLLVVGRRDPVVPRRYVEGLCRRIEGARGVEVPGAGHGVVFDRRDAFDRIVARFVRGCGEGGAAAGRPA